MKATRPSELELQVLSVLWKRGPSTAREVLESMPDGKARAYTTILSVLQVMEKKSLVRHTNRGTAHVYDPIVSERQVLGPMLRGLVSNIFGGSPSAALQQLLSETDVSREELTKIRELIDSHEGQSGARDDEGGT
jgi:predicted transcriptional regulator